jgi:acetyl/propionyl-CoA carboxylase alpha subunit
VADVSRLRVRDRLTGAVAGEFEGSLPEDPSALVRPIGKGALEVVIDGWRFEYLVEDADRADLRARATRDRGAAGYDGPTEVRAIIPGRVVSVAVSAGDPVTAGQRLLAVEAMKMENEVRAPRAGTVERVAVAPDATVELGDLLVVIS